MNLSDRGQGVLKYLFFAVLAVALALVIISVSSGFIMDYYWFSAVGFRQVFMVNVKYQLLLLFVGWIATVTCLFFAWRNVKKALGNEISNIGDWLFKGFSIFLGFGVGWWFKGQYLVFLKYLNQSPWNVTDPVFANDLSFYIFTLPFVKTLLAFVGIISGLVFFLSIFIYGIGKSDIEGRRGVEGPDISENPEGSGEWSFSRFLNSWPVLGSVGVLTSVAAVFTWLGRYSYLWGFDPGASIPTQASYMAVNYHIPYTWVKAFGVLLVGGLIIYIIRNSGALREKLEVGSPSDFKKEIAIVGVLILIFGIIPQGVLGVINGIHVKPNEPGIQQEYLERTIEGTNQGYSMENITEVPYTIDENDKLTSDEALSSPTVKNARIVDYRPTKQVYEQKQRLKLYYEFPEIDVDRYNTENGKRITVLSAKELDVNNVPSRGGRWQINHLIYTHGFGSVLSPADKVQSDGSPILAVKNTPPKSIWENTKIENPRIYFGEETNNYALVGLEDIDEFDYPKTGGEARNRFLEKHPDRGIKIKSFWKQLVAWFYTGDLNIMTRKGVGENSSLLLHRNVHTRVNKIAPFLRFDSNAHLFIENKGGLKYLLNGITHAQNYPYSYTGGNAPGYLSDSVKAYVSADSGKVDLYAIRENDPIVKTFSKIYPGIFKDKKIPSNYREHLIYPNELFNTQMGIYRRYHMDDYETFYQQGSFWSFSEELYHGSNRRVEAYNILYDTKGLKGFENDDKEFMLVQPFTPEGKNNLTSWIGVGQDGKNYGEKVILDFPGGELTRGPRQIESIISQDTRISQRISLWSQRGSQVLRGNLLTLPVKDDILYIEPLYLTASDLGYPQLKRVIAVYRDRAVMENSLERAVMKALGEEVIQKPQPGPEPGENVAPVELVNLVKEYLELSRKYNQLVAENNFGEAGRIKENMLEIERDMRDQTS